MDFMISGTHISAVYLMGIGFVVSILGGFLGLVGSFLTWPALFAMGRSPLLVPLFGGPERVLLEPKIDGESRN